jgi:diguanylate cyclase (GGDEF)-like protein
MRPLSIAAFLAAVLASLPARAFEPQRAITQYASRLWTTDHGLPQNTVTAIRQTRDNFLWLGTKAGLTRFDGVRFEVFDAANTPELPDSWINTLAEDRQGRLWIGSWLGLTVYEAGHFRRFREIERISSTVFSIEESRSGDLFFGTARGVVRYDGRDLHPLGQAQGLRPGYIRDLVEDRSGALWIAIDEGGVTRYDGRTFKAYTTRDGLPSDSIWKLLVDREGTLWVATYKGLARLRGERFQSYASAPGMPRRDLRVLFEDRDGNLWIGAHGGITRIIGDRSKTLEGEHGLPEQVVSSFAEDDDGSFWVGTDNGLWRLTRRPFSVWGRSEGMARDVIWALCEDRRGVLWVGTDGAGLFALENGRMRRAFSTRDGLPGDAINSLHEDREGRLWIGTDLGLARLERGRIHAVSERDGIEARVVRALGQDAEGRLLVGQPGVVSRLENGVFRDVSREFKLEGADPVTAFLPAHDGTLWISTAGSGLRRVAGHDAEVLDESRGLINGYVYSIHEGADGALWLPTGGKGLVRFKDGKWSAIGHAQGLSDDVFHVLEDARGQYWIGSHYGVIKVSASELTAVAEGRASTLSAVILDSADGLRSHECIDGGPGAIKGRDGVLWFATARGVARINPEGDWPPLVPSTVILESLLVNQVPVPPGHEPLPAGVRNLEFRYTAPSYIAPEKLRFRYRLEGYDQGWNLAGGRRAAYYTNVKGGTYRFVVGATLDPIRWNGPKTAHAFVIRRHFLETRWPYLFGAALVALLGAGLQRVRQRARFRRLQERERELTRLVETRTNELRLAKEALEERARDLTVLNAQLEQISKFDSLTGVHNRRSFDVAIEEEWRRAVRLGNPLSLLLLDLDRFKEFNDLYGHPAGDECLRRVAGLLRESIQRVSDLVARYGGEEFVVILPNTWLAGATELAERIRSGVQQLAIRHEAAAERDVVTVSLGVACMVPTPASGPSALVEAADAALYRAKRDGRNRVRTA